MPYGGSNPHCKAGSIFVKHWTLTFRVIPPSEVVSARFGGSVFFAAYSKWLRQWYLIANGTEEKIEEPQMLFLEEDYVRTHPSNRFCEVPAKRIRHSRRQAQLSLDLK